MLYVVEIPSKYLTPVLDARRIITTDLRPPGNSGLYQMPEAKVRECRHQFGDLQRMKRAGTHEAHLSSDHVDQLGSSSRCSTRITLPARVTRGSPSPVDHEEAPAGGAFLLIHRPNLSIVNRRPFSPIRCWVYIAGPDDSHLIASIVSRASGKLNIKPTQASSGPASAGPRGQLGH